MWDSVEVDRDVAVALRDACEVLAEAYRSELKRLDQLDVLDAFGTLRSSQLMAKKFNDKAFGETDSLKFTLDSHVAVVQKLADYFRWCVEQYEAVDAGSASVLGRSFGG